MEKYTEYEKIIGNKPVIEILQTHPDRIIKVFIKKTLPFHEKKIFLNLARKKGISINEIDGKKLDLITGPNISHQGIIALLSRSEPVKLVALLDMTIISPLPLILALDQIQDQGNLGTIARTAYAMGCGGLLLPRYETASLAAGAWRASAGALEKIPVCVVTNLAKALDEAEERDFNILGTISEKDCPASTFLKNVFTNELKTPAVVVLGNENKGIRPGILKRCSSVLTIPFARNFDSINIAQAAAIIMGLFAKSLYK